MGAIASGGGLIVNDRVISSLGVTTEQLDAAIARETAELRRRELAYRGDERAVGLNGRHGDPGRRRHRHRGEYVRRPAGGPQLRPEPGGGGRAGGATIGVPTATGARPTRWCSRRCPTGSRRSARCSPTSIRSPTTRCAPRWPRRPSRTASHSQPKSLPRRRSDACGPSRPCCATSRRRARRIRRPWCRHRRRPRARAPPGSPRRARAGRRRWSRRRSTRPSRRPCRPTPRLVVTGIPGAFPQRVDDEQQHTDDARPDAHPGDQLVAGDDGGDEGGQPDDGKDQRNDQHESADQLFPRLNWLKPPPSLLAVESTGAAEPRWPSSSSCDSR